MSRLCKLIDKLLRLPPEAKFSEVEAVLKEFGWALIRTKGSHRCFRRSDGAMFIVPTIKGRTVKTTYLKRLVENLKLEDYYEHNCR